MPACLLVFATAALTRPPLPGAFAVLAGGGQPGTTPTSGRGTKTRRAGLVKFVNRQRRRRLYRAVVKGQFKVVYHYTSCEAAESIARQRLFRVSQDRRNDATFGCGFYVAAIPGDHELGGRETVARENFGRATEEFLRKSQCYFVIEMDFGTAAELHETEVWTEEGWVKRQVLLIPAKDRSATEVTWSELGRVSGPYWTHDVPQHERAMELARLGARRLARERARRVTDSRPMVARLQAEAEEDYRERLLRPEAARLRLCMPTAELERLLPSSRSRLLLSCS